MALNRHFSKHHAVYEITKVHNGGLFDLYSARMNDFGSVCIKIPRADIAAILSALNQPQHPSGNIACFQGRADTGSELYGSVWPVRALSSLDVIKLLEIEMKTVRMTDGAWNHNVIGMGDIDDKGLFLETDFLTVNPGAQSGTWPIAIMPLYSARTLLSCTHEEKLRLFPQMLPALWEALTANPHGDLSESNLLLDRDEQLFRIIDPGAYHESHVNTPGPYIRSRTNYLFTTNTANYPLLFPFEHLRHSRWFDGLTLEQIGDVLEHSFGSPRRESASASLPALTPGSRPTAADLQALGFLYFRILSNGKELSSCFSASDWPAWSGGFASPSRFPLEVRYNFIETGTYTKLDAAMAQLKPSEAALVRSLVLLETKTIDDLTTLVQDVLRN